MTCAQPDNVEAKVLASRRRRDGDALSSQRRARARLRGSYIVGAARQRSTLASQRRCEGRSLPAKYGARGGVVQPAMDECQGWPRASIETGFGFPACNTWWSARTHAMLTARPTTAPWHTHTSLAGRGMGHKSLLLRWSLAKQGSARRKITRLQEVGCRVPLLEKGHDDSVGGE